ncbi:unnamed protein product, partial [Hymenolepis diminuta]
MVHMLKDICVRNIAENIDRLTTRCSDCLTPKLVWRTLHTSSFINAEAAGQILEELTLLLILQPEHLDLFSFRFVHLNSVDFDVRYIPIRLLNFLRHFTLRSIKIRHKGVNENLSEILRYQSEETLRNLKTLRVTNAITTSEDFMSLGVLTNLQNLDLSSTTLTNENLNIIVEEVPLLKWLNISTTRVRNINPLRIYGENLEGLIMRNIDYDLNTIESDVMLTLIELKGLQHLDVTYTKNRNSHLSLFGRHLCSYDRLPILEHFEMNGNLFLATAAEIRNFILTHRNLKCLVLCNGRNGFDSREVVKIEADYPGVLVLGDSGKPLWNLLTMENFNPENIEWNFSENLNIVKEFLNADFRVTFLRFLRNHANDSTLMLYCARMLVLLSSAPNNEFFPGEFLAQIFNNIISLLKRKKWMSIEDDMIESICFSGLCSDVLLRRVKFDHEKHAKMLFDYFNYYGTYDWQTESTFHALKSFSKWLSQDEKMIITANISRLQCLLNYAVKLGLPAEDVRALTENGKNSTFAYIHGDEGVFYIPSHPSNFRLHFVALGVLWRFLNNCPEAIKVFIQIGGVKICELFLKNAENLSVTRKNMAYALCLTILSLVSEIPSLKHFLMSAYFIHTFNQLLHHSTPEVGFYAAHILAHLACQPNESWIIDGIDRKPTSLSILGLTISYWVTFFRPTMFQLTEFPSFQSMRSIIFDQNTEVEIRLWALYSLRHALTVSRSEYMPLVTEDTVLHEFLTILSGMPNDTVILTMNSRSIYQKAYAIQTKYLAEQILITLSPFL